MTTWSPTETASIQQHLAALLAHPLFTQAERLAKFHFYIVDAVLKGDAAKLNQNAIAIDVFGRGADFDPSADSIVRVEAGRLRAKLREYYDTVENEDGIRIELPRGGYVPEITISTSSTAKKAQKPVSVTPTPSTNRSVVISIGAIFSIVIASYVLVTNRADKPEETTAVILAVPVATKVVGPISVVLNETPSIAVLPFVNMSGDPEQEYFSDGIAEEILNALARLDNLRVMARTSSFYFKGKDVPLTEIAEKLNVEHVLEGSVRKSGERLRITAKLIDTNKGFQLWSESYDRDLGDIFNIQEEIAQAIIKAMRIELGLSGSIVTFGTDNRETYDFYLRGKNSLIAGIGTDVSDAINYLQRAIELDPQFADAYGHLAYAHILRHPYTPYQELAPFIKDAFDKALAIEPMNSAALASKAHYEIFVNWDWQSAGKLFNAALQKGEKNSVWHQLYEIWYLQSLQYFDKSIQLLREAIKEDPLNVFITASLAWTLTFTDDIEESIVYYEGVRDVFPYALDPPLVLTMIYLNVGRLDEAEITLNKLKQLDQPGAHQFATSLQVELHVQREEMNKAQSVYNKALNYAQNTENVSPGLWFNLGLCAVLLGNIDEAAQLFVRADKEGAAGPVLLRTYMTKRTTYANGYGSELLTHPEIQKLLRKMNLDDDSIASLQPLE